MTGESDNVVRTFRAAPLDGGYTNPALHDPVELGLYVELWMLCLDAFQLDGHCKYKGQLQFNMRDLKLLPSSPVEMLVPR